MLAPLKQILDASSLQPLVDEESGKHQTYIGSSTIEALMLDVNKKLKQKSEKDFHKRSYPTRVSIYAIFQRVEEIDNVNERFKAKIYIESRWRDDSVESETTFIPEKHWNPLIYIQNVSGKVKQQKKYRIEKKNLETIVCEMRSIESSFSERYLVLIKF